MKGETGRGEAGGAHLTTTPTGKSEALRGTGMTSPLRVMALSIMRSLHVVAFPYILCLTSFCTISNKDVR